MNVAQKFNKLGNAIREYRGMYDEKTGIWKYPPKPKAKVRVARWLREVGIDEVDGLSAVDGFKHFNEFRAWMKEKQAKS